MMFKTLAAVAMSAGLATAAFAQTSSGSGDAAGNGGQGDSPPKTWEAPINNAFYDSNGMLRTQADIQANWAKLDTTQQDKVRADCMGVDASNAEMAKACDMVKGM